MASMGGLLRFSLGFTFPVVAASPGDGKNTVDVVPAIEQNGTQAMLKFRVRHRLSQVGVTARYDAVGNTTAVEDRPELHRHS